MTPTQSATADARSGIGPAKLIRLSPDRPLPPALQGHVVAIGNFDGIHRGHQHILRLAARQAKAAGTGWGMVTFSPHPRAFFRSREPFFHLTQEPVKHRLVSVFGGSFMAVLQFDQALAEVSAPDFVNRILATQLRISHAVVGYDFHFGHNREGNAGLLAGLGQRQGFCVTVADKVADRDGYRPISSSAIRENLRRGRISQAARDLNHWWTITGQVIRGDGHGRQLGFPTANLALDSGCGAADGSYAVRVRRLDQAGAPVWQGAGYIGARPTFGVNERRLEVFIFDFAGDLYGAPLGVEFIDYIRPDEKFATERDLIHRIHQDCQEIRRRLETAATTPGDAGVSPFS